MVSTVCLRTRRALVLIVASAVAIATVGAMPFPGETARAESGTSAGWTTNGSASPVTVTRGTTVTIRITVKSSTSRSALIDLEVADSGATIAQRYWDRQTFKAGQTRAYSFSWTPSATANLGVDTVRVGIFGTGWNGLQHWNGSAAAFAVVQTTTTTTTTTTAPATTTTVAPTTTTTIPPTTTTTTVPPTTTTIPAPAAHFETLPVGAALPSEATCASSVRPTAEVRAMNATPNHTKGAAPLSANARVTGNFTGTTDEIIQWAACKWGIDEDIVRAQIAKESYWKHATGGDFTTDQSRCHPSLRTTDGSPCPESYGLGQVRYAYHTAAMDDSIRSSAFNLDYTYSQWRTCYEGTQTWLNQFERGQDYAAGDVWGCVGLWFAGRWHTQPANDYIAAVQGYLAQRIWSTPSFLGYAG